VPKRATDVLTLLAGAASLMLADYRPPPPPHPATDLSDTRPPHYR
jgi:hypothetical protein